MCYFVLLNRYRGIVMVPGSFLKAGDVGWPDPHPSPQLRRWLHRSPPLPLRTVTVGRVREGNGNDWNATIPVTIAGSIPVNYGMSHPWHFPIAMTLRIPSHFPIAMTLFTNCDGTATVQIVRSPSQNLKGTTKVQGSSERFEILNIQFSRGRIGFPK